MDLRHVPAEVHIDEALVRALLEEQHPQIGCDDLSFVDEGDVATDLACIRLLFDSAAARAALVEAYAPSAAVLARAAGWAVNLASALLDSGEPRHVSMGLGAVRRLVSP